MLPIIALGGAVAALFLSGCRSQSNSSSQTKSDAQSGDTLNPDSLGAFDSAPDSKLIAPGIGTGHPAKPLAGAVDSFMQEIEADVQGDGTMDGASDSAPEGASDTPVGSSVKVGEDALPQKKLRAPSSYEKPILVDFSKIAPPADVKRRSLAGFWNIYSRQPIAKLIEIPNMGLMKITMDPVVNLDNSFQHYLFTGSLDGQSYSLKVGDDSQPNELLKGDFNKDEIADLAVGFSSGLGILFHGREEPKAKPEF